MKQYFTRWTPRRVIECTHRKQIKRLIMEDDKTPGHGDFLGAWPGALSRIMEDLTEKELEDAIEKADEWNHTDPPPEIQAMCAHSFHIS